MNNKQLDLLLQNSFPELPPEDIAKKVNPWKRFIFYIILGLILNTDLIEVKYLSSLLPTIGNVFLVLGFQALRKENRFFKMGWILSLITFAVMPILKTNPRSFTIGEDSAILILLVILLAVAFYSIFRCLALGITRIQEECGQEVNHKLQRIILGCSSALVFLNLLSNKPVWMTYLVTAIYIILVLSIIRLMKEIDEVGYGIQIAPILLSGKMLVFITVMMFCIGLFMGGISISPEPKSQTEWNISNSNKL